MREWIWPRPDQMGAAPLTEADLREAYARGRRDERARRRRSPLAFLTISLATLAGAGMLAVSASQGAFINAGAVVGDQLANAGISAGPHPRDAAVEFPGAPAHAGDEARVRTRSLVGG